MPKPADRIVSGARALADRLGRCSKCMHSAFITACAASAAAAILSLAGIPAIYPVLAWSATALVLGLWLAHVWRFTLRSARATALLSDPGSGDSEEFWTRRRLLKAFLKVLVFSAAVSALPRGLGAQSCNCYTQNNCYCPDDFPQCIYNPTTGEAVCCGPNAVGCAGPRSTWCCSPGYNCYGNDNQCY